jgi:hypothetical protein
MSKIPLKYNKRVLFYTKYTHPTLICRGADGRMDGRMDGRKIFTQYSGISSCSLGSTDSDEVRGRYADDARLIRASVTAPTSVVGSHSKLPSSVIILINGRLFSLGSRVCTSILTLRFWHHTNYHSILVTYPPHAVTLPRSLTNLGPVSRLELLRVGG